MGSILTKHLLAAVLLACVPGLVCCGSSDSTATRPTREPAETTAASSNKDIAHNRRETLDNAPAVTIVRGAINSADHPNATYNSSKTTVTTHATTGTYHLKRHELEVLSPIHMVDKIFPSMRGPESLDSLRIGPESTTVQRTTDFWLTGFEAVMVAADGQTPMPQQFMCHSRVRFLQPGNRRPDVFTLSQGQISIEFPDGFGMPLSAEPIGFDSQVLNLHHHGDPLEVRSKITMKFVRDSDLIKPMKPLREVMAFVVVSLEEEAWFNELEGGLGACCQVGVDAAYGAATARSIYTDKFGRKFSTHWVVKPGRHEYRRSYKAEQLFTRDTTIHYIACHLHPFAESLELRDLTTNETVFKSHCRNFEDFIGLEHVEEFSSVEGIPVYAFHEYESVAIYNNTSGQDQDAMAAMFMYILDKTFNRDDG
jgi:hypothetical protein